MNISIHVSILASFWVLEQMCMRLGIIGLSDVLRPFSTGAAAQYSLDYPIASCEDADFRFSGSIEGARLQLFHNRISGGTGAQENDGGANIMKVSTDSVLIGNTLVNNTMDGLQVRKAIAPFIDHNTIADNGGSGTEGEPSASFQCLELSRWRSRCSFP